MRIRADHQHVRAPCRRIAHQRIGHRAARHRRIDDGLLDLDAAIGEQRRDPLVDGLRFAHHVLARGRQQRVDARDVGQDEARVVDGADDAQSHAGTQQRACIACGGQRFGRRIDGQRDPRKRRDGLGRLHGEGLRACGSSWNDDGGFARKRRAAVGQPLRPRGSAGCHAKRGQSMRSA